MSLTAMMPVSPGIPSGLSYDPASLIVDNILAVTAVSSFDCAALVPAFAIRDELAVTTLVNTEIGET
jgi:hypothetical protein